MTTTSNTVAQTRSGSDCFEDAELDAVTGGWGLINFGTSTSSSGKIDRSDFRITKASNGSSPL
jgi:hypothetical protein